MHYDSYGNGVFRNPAMVKLDGSIIEPNKKMSELDIVTLNKMYPCENSCDQKNGKHKTIFLLKFQTETTSKSDNFCLNQNVQFRH